MADRQRDERTYIKVHDGMPDHPKVEALSDRAFRLLVETWCWCSRHLTDGRVPRASWNKRGTAAARRELVDAGLVEEHRSEVVMHDYLEHQRSAAEVAEIKQQRRRISAQGNHNRWHAGPKGKPNPDCPLCSSLLDPLRDSGRDPARDPVGDPGSLPEASTETETETETETDLPVVTSGGDRPEADAQARATKPPQRPPERCTQHGDHDGDPGPCRGCAKARERAEQCDRDARQDSLRAIRACRWCDAAGVRIDPDNRHRGSLGVTCDHTPATREQLEELAS